MISLFSRPQRWSVLLMKPWAFLFLLMILSGCSSLPSLQESGDTQQATITTPQTAKPPASASPRPQAVPVGKTAPQQGQPAPSVRGTKVALLLPLSGNSAPLGQAMANAAQLAVFDMGVDQFELMPRDTKGTKEGAAKAAREAIASGAQLLIGPLFAADVVSVKPVATGAQVNMLALSTDVSLGEPGAYVMGFAPTPQVDRVIAYAASQGMRRFAALTPTGAYGQLVARAFRDAVEHEGGIVVALETNGTASSLIPHKDDIDALFVPYGGEALKQVVGQLEAAGFDAGRTRLLGTGLWDEPNTSGGHPLLIGGWYAAPEPDLRASFTQNYQASFGKEPPRLASLAYDATAMAAVLSRQQMGFDQRSLTLPGGFAGIDGVFRLNPNGQIERGLAINELTATGSRVVDPSPRSFRP